MATFSSHPRSTSCEVFNALERVTDRLLTESVLCCVRHRTQVKAARVLGIKQPALSKRITAASVAVSAALGRPVDLAPLIRSLRRDPRRIFAEPREVFTIRRPAA